MFSRRLKICTIWLAICLPWITGVTLLVIFCIGEFSNGRNFVPGLHVFGWMAKGMLGACFYFPSLLLAMIIARITRHLRVDQWQLVRPMVIIFLSLFIPLAAFPLMSSCFHTGRSIAYQRLDCEAIYADCLLLRQKMVESECDSYAYNKWQNTDAELPASLANLDPMTIEVKAGYARIRMDGGGIASEEGIFVLLPSNDKPDHRITYMKPLHTSIPVYSF